MRVTLLGPPGVGKGTLAARLSSRWGVPHLSTGELLRAAMREGTDAELVETAKVILSGAFVPDAVANRLVFGRLEGVSGFVLDGFPRTIPQAEALDQFLAQRGLALDAALLLDADDAVIDARISQRRICRGCGRAYDLRLDPPREAGLCDGCGGELILRPEEDTTEKAALRRQLYRNRTEGVIAFYQSSGRLRRIDASGPPDAVERTACEAVRGAV